MVLGTLLASAVPTAHSAFSYNMGRYTFDTNQYQRAAFHGLSFTLDRWKLFREDIKDLFNLATSNMSSYMLFGTLFLGYSVGFLRSVLDKFPADPPWLIILWGNCLIPGICYGLLGVWFAVHGNIAAHAACAQMLTQAIRPPIPDMLKKIDEATHNIAEYEADKSKISEVPNWFGMRDAAEQMTATGGGHPSSSAAAASSSSSQSPGIVPGTSIPGDPSLDGVAGVPEPSKLLRQGRASVFKYIAEARGAKSIFDQLGEPIGSSPGPPATLYGHVRFFQEIQSTYASFHAYAQVCLHASVCQVLFAFAYYIVAEAIDRVNKTEGVDGDLWSKYLLWFGAGIFMFTCLLLTKIDLYVPRKHMRFIKFVLILGPLVAGLAGQLDVVSGVSDNVVYPFLTLTCFMHALHTWLLLVKEAEPEQQGRQGGLMLPIKFRAVQNLDVTRPLAHSYHTEYEQPSSTPRELIPSRVNAAPMDEEMQSREEAPSPVPAAGTRGAPSHAKALASARRLQQTVSRLLDGDACDQLTGKEVSELIQLKEQLLTVVTPGYVSFRSMESMGLGAAEWMQAEHSSGAGTPLPYYVNLRNGEMQWEIPQGEQLIDLTMISGAVQQFVARLKPPVDDEGNALDPSGGGQVAGGQPAADSVWTSAESFESDDDDELGAVTRVMSYHQRRTLNKVLKGTGSRKEAQDMPWLYFRQMSLAVIFVWIATLVGTLIIQLDTFFNFYSGPSPPSSQLSTVALISSTHSLEVAWPHSLFSPSAVACGGGMMVLGDRFDIFATMLPDNRAMLQPLDMQVLVSADDLPAPWIAFALVCGEGQEGHEVGIAGCSKLLMLEQGGRAIWEQPLPTKGTQPRRWPLGVSFGDALQSITVASNATDHCTGAIDWAVFGVTESGEAAVFCPHNAKLQPARLVATRSDIGPSVRLGMQGDFWNLEKDFSLPKGRRWAKGLCEIGEVHGERSDRSFVVAGVVESTAELYQVGGPPEKPSLHHHVDEA